MTGGAPRASGHGGSSTSGRHSCQNTSHAAARSTLSVRIFRFSSRTGAGRTQCTEWSADARGVRPIIVGVCVACARGTYSALRSVGATAVGETTCGTAEYLSTVAGSRVESRTLSENELCFEIIASHRSQSSEWWAESSISVTSELRFKIITARL